MGEGYLVEVVETRRAYSAGFEFALPKVKVQRRHSCRLYFQKLIIRLFVGLEC